MIVQMERPFPWGGAEMWEHQLQPETSSFLKVQKHNYWATEL